MKRTGLTLLVILLSITITIAQDKGVKFEQGLSWQQVKEKARAENKFIFVDLMATWCAPCKMMDASTYSNEKVGDAVNSKFISVKVQIDKTANDNDQVKSWYNDADAFMKDYRVAALPTFLFFSPDGKIVHRGTAYLSVDDFLKLTAAALDPSKQLYTSYAVNAANYRKGERDYPNMMSLITNADVMGDATLRDSLKHDYLFNYLDKLSDNELFATPANLAFLSFNVGLITSNSNVFKLFNDPEKSARADKLIGIPGWSDKMVSFIVNREEIDSKIYKDYKIVDNNPDWNGIRNTISSKYNKPLAEELVLTAQVNYYNTQKDWKKYTAYYDEKLKKFPPRPNTGESFGVNNAAWQIFLSSDDKQMLNKAVNWIDIALKVEADPNEQYFDTKANLLYKLGRTKEGIATEQEAIEHDRAAAKKANKEKGVMEDMFQATIEKMTKGQPTWGPGVQ